MYNRPRIILKSWKPLLLSNAQASVSTIGKKVVKRSANSIKHSSLPTETLYILDGTAMLYYAYFSEWSKTKFGNATFSATFSKEWMSQQTAEVLDRIKVETTQVNTEQIVNIDNTVLSCSALSAMAFNFAHFVNTVQPTYLAIAFDSKVPTFRKEMYDEYKKQRKRSPIELLPQMEIAPRVFETFGCKCFQEDRYEADDVMASLGKWAKSKGLCVVHVSLDKDMLQLIDHGVYVMDPRTMEVHGKERTVEKYGIPPERLVDLLAIMGDSVDNIPGVPGFGEKMAFYLIDKFGPIENIFEQLHLANLPPADPALVAQLMTLSARASSSSSSTGEADESEAAEKPKKSKKSEEKTPADKEEAKKKKAEIERLRTELTNQLVAAMGQEKYDQSCALIVELLAANKSTKRNPNLVLLPLYMIGLDQLLLYKRLIKLHDEIPVISSKDLTASMGGGNQKTEVIVLQSTQELRYRGEKKFSQKSIEDLLLHTFSDSLTAPLNYLRQAYHKLDRSE